MEGGEVHGRDRLRTLAQLRQVLPGSRYCSDGIWEVCPSGVNAKWFGTGYPRALTNLLSKRAASARRSDSRSMS